MSLTYILGPHKYRNSRAHRRICTLSAGAVFCNSWACILLNYGSDSVWHLAPVSHNEMGTGSNMCKWSQAQCHIDAHCLICCHGD